MRTLLSLPNSLSSWFSFVQTHSFLTFYRYIFSLFLPNTWNSRRLNNPELFVFGAIRAWPLGMFVRHKQLLVYRSKWSLKTIKRNDTLRTHTLGIFHILIAFRGVCCGVNCKITIWTYNFYVIIVRTMNTEYSTVWGLASPISHVKVPI